MQTHRWPGTSHWQRHPLSATVAHLCFVRLLWCWIRERLSGASRRWYPSKSGPSVSGCGSGCPRCLHFLRWLMSLSSSCTFEVFVAFSLLRRWYLWLWFSGLWMHSLWSLTSGWILILDWVFGNICGCSGKSGAWRQAPGNLSFWGFLGWNWSSLGSLVFAGFGGSRCSGCPSLD